jgi:hypothetical protein
MKVEKIFSGCYLIFKELSTAYYILSTTSAIDRSPFGIYRRLLLFQQKPHASTLKSIKARHLPGSGNLNVQTTISWP